MAVVVLLSAATAAAQAGDAVRLPQRHVRPATGIVQSIATGTATGVIQGSLDGANWSDILSLTGNDIEEVRLPLFVRGVASAVESGTLTLLLEY